MPDINVSFELMCSCGAELDCTVNQEQITTTLPCQDCIKDARAEAYNEGYDEGYDEGCSDTHGAV